MISLDMAKKLIHSFWPDNGIFNGCENSDQLIKLQNEKNTVFPKEFHEFFAKVVSENDYYFSMVGNPISLLSSDKYSWTMPGYNFNPVTNEVITDWESNWFLFADEGSDPIIIDISEQTEYSTVYKAMHGAGKWDFTPIASSLGQFILCASALHHALTGFDIEDSIIDDDYGFNLAEIPADFLFPLIEKHAADFCDDWVSVFDNY